MKNFKTFHMSLEYLEKCPYLELFWSAFFHISHILCISLHSFRMRENGDQNNSEYGHFLRSVKQWSTSMKLFSLPVSHQNFLRFWNKYFRTKIYRNIPKFAFQVLQECGSWASKNGAMKMFFLTPAGNQLFVLCCRSTFFIMSDLMFVK